ncbi:DUF1634 domain-containing protein [Calothrix sp. 336/3]|uniref:DUF1634 domain-containing protein n=1 Tax=Calothrix sp. 336/3 TaxID=1337936 RepID=UPI0004E42B6B|nr:DUF1634 domain-containing protein [Calothrix sp. 336/3]AKG20023.1 hypothetical protein IJ00_00710 [Calothrix sp. 336/3]
MFKLNSQQLITSAPEKGTVIHLPLASPNPAETPAPQISENSQLLKTLLSGLLKYGVLIASSVVLFGGILYLVKHGRETAEYHFFQGEPSQFRSPTGAIAAAASGSYRGIIQVGLLLLIAIPILRVIISLLIFLKQRHWIYVTITTLVLTALMYSLLAAYF